MSRNSPLRDGKTLSATSRRPAGVAAGIVHKRGTDGLDPVRAARSMATASVVHVTPGYGEEWCSITYAVPVPPSYTRLLLAVRGPPGVVGTDATVPLTRSTSISAP